MPIVEMTPEELVLDAEGWAALVSALDRIQAVLAG
jgi:hypothetical protein